MQYIGVRVALCAVLLLPAVVSAATIHVDDNAPADPAPGDVSTSDPAEDGSEEHPYDAIQEAVEGASDDDVISVADGIYVGQGNRDIEFAGKAIAVRSERGPGGCVIDCEGSQEEPHRGFLFENGENEASVIDGLTITGGFQEEGGAVLCLYTSPRILNCIIIGNSAAKGGGIMSRVADCLVEGCLITDNTADDGGGVNCTYGSPELTNNLIAGNSASYGAGVHILGANVLMSHCTVVNNVADEGGGIGCHSGAACRVDNSIFWSNSGSEGPQMHVKLYSFYMVEYCDVSGGEEGVPSSQSDLIWGAGNIDSDPLFADAEGGNYRLLPGSPCIDAAQEGDISADIEGKYRPVDWPEVDNNGGLPQFDMGAYEAELLTADINGDFCVNIADLLSVRDRLGKTGSEMENADVNSDGICNVADLLLVRDSLGKGPRCQ